MEFGLSVSTVGKLPYINLINVNIDITPVLFFLFFFDDVNKYLFIYL